MIYRSAILSVKASAGTVDGITLASLASGFLRFFAIAILVLKLGSFKRFSCLVNSGWSHVSLNVSCGFLLALISIIASTAAGAGEFEEAAKAYSDRDYAIALDRWTKLAERGDGDAEYNVACMLVRGHGTPPNREQAIVWFRKAAEQGQSDARNWLYLETPDHLNDEKPKIFFAGKFRATVIALMSFKAFARCFPSLFIRSASIPFIDGYLARDRLDPLVEVITPEMTLRARIVFGE